MRIRNSGCHPGNTTVRISWRAITVMTSIFVGLMEPLAGFAQAAPGYAVTDFATGFATIPVGGFVIGPLGLAFDSSGNLFVGDPVNSLIYKFGPAGGVASAATQLNATPVVGGILGLTFGKDGSLFVARQGAGDVVQVDVTTGAVLRTVASGIPLATGLATDPLSGDLFVSALGTSGAAILRIANFANGPGTVSVYVSTGYADGLAFGRDGTLYAATGGSVTKISGTNSANPGSMTVVASNVPYVDGLAISSVPNAPFLYGNRNDGIITKIDLTTAPATLTDIYSGGGRGDFVAVGFDGCLYATQSDRILKVTNADGSCLPAPLGPLQPTTAQFAFYSFSAQVELSGRIRPSFESNARFSLAATSDGLSPLTEAVTLQLGNFPVTIPAGSFKANRGGNFVFEGVINGVKLEVQIVPLGNNSFTFKAEGSGPSLASLTKPVNVTLTIGNDTGSTPASGEHN
jgi:hypothetical protein